nr:GNAT family N-acetyltransferase [Candidatus Njordarchaeota archaeon]
MEIRNVRDSDLSDVVSFHNAYHDDKRTVKQWLWEYGGMNTNAFVFSIMRDKGRVVGTQGMIPIPIIIKGKRLLSGKSESSLLDSKYRGRTFFKDLYEFAVSRCKEKGMCCIWGFTSAARVWREKLRFYVDEDCMCECTLVLNPRPILSELLRSRDTIAKKLAYSLETTYVYLSSLIFRTKSLRKMVGNKFSIKRSLKSANDIRSLFERLRLQHPHLIHIDQDKKYLRWRLFSNPNVKYRTFFVYEGSLLRAYCHLAIDCKKAYLTDFTCEDDAAGVLLIRSLLRELRDGRFAYLSFLGNSRNSIMDSTFGLLKSFGFVKRRFFYLPFVLRNLSQKNEKSLYDIGNWYLNALWTEGYVY